MSVEAQIAIPVAVVIALVVVSLGDGRRGSSKIQSRHCTRGQHISLLRLSLREALETLKEKGLGIPDRNRWWWRVQIADVGIIADVHDKAAAVKAVELSLMKV